jgi:hypothetical protein
MMMARSGLERMEMGFDMFDDALRLMEAGLRADHPGASEQEMRRLMLFRLYGNDLPAPWLEKAAKASTWRCRTAAGRG